MSALFLTSLTENTATFELDYQFYPEQFPCKIVLGKELLVWRGFWENVGQITKIERENETKTNFLLGNNNLNLTNTESKSKNWEKGLESKQKKPQEKSSNFSGKMKIHCVGNFENCGWQSLWQINEGGFINPEMWQNTYKLNPALENKTDNKTENKEANKISDTPNLTENSTQNLSPNAEINPVQNQPKFTFIPTVQNNEKVVAGQKIGFVEKNGDLFWLIVPNWEACYQIQIGSGDFDIFEKIGELKGDKNYVLTLNQSLDLNLCPTKKMEKMWNSGLLFDIFCPALVGSRTLLSNFDLQDITILVDNLNTETKKPIFISNFDLPDNSDIFYTQKPLELAQYFVLSGFNVALITDKNLKWQENLNRFGNFITPSEEVGSLTLFYVFDNSKEKLECELLFFHNFWQNQTQDDSHNQKSDKPQTVSKISDIFNSYTRNNFEEILKKNLGQQNSFLVNQDSTLKLPNKLTLQKWKSYYQNPIFQAIFKQENSKLTSQKGNENLQNRQKTSTNLPNAENVLALWNFWEWVLEENILTEMKKEFETELKNLIKKIKLGQFSTKRAKEELIKMKAN